MPDQIETGESYAREIAVEWTGWSAEECDFFRRQIADAFAFATQQERGLAQRADPCQTVTA